MTENTLGRVRTSVLLFKNRVRHRPSSFFLLI